MLLALSSAAFADEIEDVEAGNAYIPEDTVINLILLDKLDSNVYSGRYGYKFNTA